jgi:hypothetical protein
MAAFGADDHQDENGARIPVTLGRLDERLIALAREVQRTEQAATEALRLAREDLHKHLAALNGNQAELLRREATYITRPDYEVRHTELDRSWRQELKPVVDRLNEVRSAIMPIYAACGLTFLAVLAVAARVFLKL